MARQGSVQTDLAPAAVGPYCQARWAGDFLFVSGQLGLDPRTGEFAGPGVAEEAGQALRNLNRILEAAGLERGQVVKVTIFLTDMDDFGLVNEVYAGFFEGVSCLPARACVAVAALPKGGKVEIEALACRSS
ncbi:hypothetical protein AAU61_10110 [Desulfocarbo indianensis]|nr:hypothetical protein AAU61_10110 [Desulfocarbo indianensis]